MSVATKLEYLNDTKQLLKENINSLGGNLTTEPFRQYASVLEGIYERIPKVSGIGSSLSLSPTMVGKIKLNEIQGNTLQENTPTPDSPIEIESVTGLQNVNVTGDNLFNPNWFTYRTTNGITATLEDDHILLNGTATASAYINFTIPSNIFNDSYSWYTKSDETLNYGLKILRSSGGNVDISPTTNWTTSRFSSTNVTGSYIYVANGTTLNNCKVYIDVRKDNIGLNDFIYEPYKGKSYEINLGKNLFDKSNITTGKRLYYWQGTAELIDDANYCVSDYIKIKPNAIYTINLTMSAYTRMIFFNNNKSPLSANETNATFTTPNNTAYVRLSVPLNQLDTTQLEKGSQATSYSTYFEPIELNKIGNYQDSIKKSTGKNLFSSKTELGTLNNSTGLPATETNCIRTKDYISVNPSTTYIISNNKGYQQILYQYDSSYNLLLANTQNSSFTTTSITKYIKLRTGVSNVENDLTSLWQLEENSQATSYEPCLPKGTWYIEKNTRRLELAINDMNNSKNYPGWKNTNETEQLKSDVYNGVNSGTLNYYTNYYNNISEYNSNGIVSNFKNQATLFLKTSTFNMTQTQWKTNYPNLVFKIIYSLQHPEIIEITNQELINQLEELYTAKSYEGTTNINVSSENLPMIINASALKGED